MGFHMEFAYEGIEALDVPEGCGLCIIEPNEVPKTQMTEQELIAECLEHPLGTKRLRDEVVGCKNILILADDYTRLTPAHLILPVLIDELVAGGIAVENIKVLVASGTHRAMTPAEKLRKYGQAVLTRVKVLDHVAHDEACLTHVGVTAKGTWISINSLMLEADYVIGVGHIVPHRVAGFSGGAKIVQPGVCGEVTTGQTHWLSAKGVLGKDIMGVEDNPVRREINEVGLRAGLRFIFNTVQAGDGSLHACFCGDPLKAFSAGCEVAREVYGCRIAELADIAIVDAYPSHMNMWQAAKGVFAGDLALKEDGILIMVASLSEGVANEHPEVEGFGYSDPDGIERLVEVGKLTDLTVAAHILHVGRVITGKRKAFLISTGLTKDRTERIGFSWAGNVNEALARALAEKGPHATIAVVKHGGEVMPLLA
jgi:nickel-dependent lactate racemase